MSRICIEQLSKTYERVAVLRNIDLTLADGAVLALLGPSGCGKTTLLRLLAGFDRADAGTITFGEKVVASSQVHVPPERRGIGYVPQEGALFPHLTVLGNIRYGLSRNAQWRQRAQEVLELTGLAGLDARFPHELSGGQQQRVALARALAPNPALILLDEPFNALDLDLRRGMCEDVIAMLRQTRTSTVLVTHDPAEAFAVADQVAVMHGGQIMQCAEPDVIYWQPASTSVARLTGAVVFLDGEFDGSRIITGLGSLPLLPARAQPVGAALAVLRPEQITLVGPDHGVRARVIKRTFRGDHVLLGIVMDNGLKLSLRTTSWSAPASGTDVYLSVQGSCVAFPADGRQ